MLKPRIKTESKQVGTLYHFCSLEDLLNHVLPEDHLKGSGYFYNKIIKSNKALSLTRNPNLKLNTLRSFDAIVRITLNGDKISERYKVKPYSAYGVSAPAPKDLNLDYDTDEMEEIVVGEIRDLHKYILGMKITFKKGYDSSYKDELDEISIYCSKYGISLDKIEVLNKGNLQTLSDFIGEAEIDPEEVYKNIKDGDLSVISKLDKDSLKKLFIKIINDIDDGYIYNLVTNLGNNADQLSSDKKSLLKNIFVDIFNEVSPDEDLEDFIEGLGYYFD